jgi:hypothetical protein
MPGSVGSNGATSATNELAKEVARIRRGGDGTMMNAEIVAAVAEITVTIRSRAMEQNHIPVSCVIEVK